MTKRNISTKFLLITASLLLAVALLMPLLVTVPTASQTAGAPAYSSQSISWVNWGSSPLSPGNGNHFAKEHVNRDSSPVPPPPNNGDFHKTDVNWGS